jgi:hypothetical protein
MNLMRTRLMAAALAAALAFIPLAEASARGGFHGGGFRSAGSARSFGSRTFGSAGSSRSPGSPSLGSPRSGGWGSATRPSPDSPPQASRIGGISGSRSSVSSRRGLYDSARRNGTLFTSREEAAQSFRSSYAKDYGSTFASEPSVRPSYIPSATYVGGRSVNVVYSPALGGYGYLHPSLGTWMLFDALADRAMLDGAMYNRGYYWGGAPVYISHGMNFMGFALFMLVLIVVVAAIARAARRRTERYYR